MKKNLLFLITVVILFLIPIVNFGQAPNLGTTSGYALFTAVGAFNNDGESVVTGDVGTNVGAFNAFPPGTLVGQKHVLDGASTTAATDVLSAYGYLAALTPLDVIDVGLGGQILGPGVHFTGSGKAATLNGTLTLDGGGNPDALFIMRIDGALSTSANSNVVLINSANVCNVYWQVNGQFDLETYSVFQGTLIASGAINLFVGSSLNGRGLSSGGAITVHTSAVTVPVCNCFVAAPTATLIQPTCVTATSTITVTAPTGIGYTYSIDGSNYTNSTGVFSQIPSGTYILTAKNSDDCISAGTNLTINVAPTTLTIPTITLVQPTCLTASKPSIPAGTITVTSPTGTGMTYSIDGTNYTNTTGVFTQVSPGTYTVTAKSPDDCLSLGKSVTINAPPDSPASPIITLTQPTCTVPTGTITVTAPAGMIYCIINTTISNTTGIFTQMSPGRYRIISKNADGCISVPGTSIELFAPQAAPAVPTVTLTQPTFTVPSGTINITSPSGTGFTYSIDGSTYTNTTGLFSLVPAGTYTITAKNLNDCISSGRSVTINALPETPAAPTVTLTQPTCLVPQGTITVSTPTGTGMTYSINGSTYTNTSGIFTQVSAGTYIVTAKNSVGGISTGTSVTINVQPVTPAALTAIPTQPTCLISTGTITVTSPTGIGMTYSIDGSTYTNSTGVFTLVSAGTYTVTAKNSDGCISSGAIVTINYQPGAPEIPTVTITHPTYTLATGIINVSAPRETGMTYSINGSTYTNTSGMFTLVSAGTYTVTAKNPDGCISSGRSVTINPQPETPPVPTVTLIQPTCLVNTGTITVSAPTGPGMTYSINGSTYTNTTGLFTTISEGIYSVTAKNSEGGISTGMSVTINAPLAIQEAPTVTLVQPTCAVATGTITVTAPTGASMTYSINGSTYTNTTGTFTLVPAGSYTVTVKNSEGCISPETSVTLNTPASSDGCISTGTIVTISTYPGTPTAAGSITGTNVVCQGQAGLIYTVPVITNATDYIWSLPAGATITAGVNTNSITVVFSVAAASGNITVQGSSSCGTGTISAPFTITVNNCNGSDLCVVKTVNLDKPIIGHNVIFTIVATNNGPTDASGVIVTDILQSGYTYISTTSTAGTYDPSTGVWTIGTLSNGASKSLTITATVNSTGDYDNTATINGDETDVNTGNNVSLTTTNPTDFFIPEGFSPNSDGTNDLFVIRGIENYPDNKIIIFDFLGTKVFEASHYNNVWDGKSVIVGEDDLAIGTYFYLLDLGDGSVIIKGTVYLSR